MQPHAASVLAIGGATLFTQAESSPVREPKPAEQGRRQIVRDFLAEVRRAIDSEPVTPRLQRWPY